MTEVEREAMLKRWAEPPSDTEQTRAENAERVIKAAISKSTELRSRELRIFVQGSYRNNTNVRLDSDVDVCVCLMETFTTNYQFAPGWSDDLLGITAATYTYSTFKNDIERTLLDAFGNSSVIRGDKAFNVRENTYRVTADVVACVEARRYSPNGSYKSGTKIYPDSGGSIENWPHHQYENGVSKNNATAYRFKRLVRIMKNLRNRMAEEANADAKPIPSFLNECLIWNVPNNLMGSTFSADIRGALIHLWTETETEEKCHEWGEANEMKYLFRPKQPWTRAQVRAWVHAAWTRLEYK